LYIEIIAYPLLIDNLLIPEPFFKFLSVSSMNFFKYSKFLYPDHPAVTPPSVISVFFLSLEERGLKFCTQTPHIDAQASFCRLHLAQPSLGSRIKPCLSPLMKFQKSSV